MTKSHFTPDPEAWKSAHYLDLAKYFHKWCPESGQYKRVHHFELESDELIEFNNLGTITSVEIHLALDSNSEEFVCAPVLHLYHDGLGIGQISLPLVGKESPNTTSPPSSDIVPGIFKEMISKNWLTIDMGLINDLFVAQKAFDPHNPNEHLQMLRVHYFWINESMVDHLNLIRTNNGNTVDGISLYPGIDMNKFQDKKMISFTPVLGIKHLNKPQGASEYGVVEKTKFETFIEYTSPCPTTCRSASTNESTAN